MANRRKMPAAAPKKKAENQNRRELIGIVLLLAALYAVLCWFNTEAFLLKHSVAFLTGVIGQVGRYLLPVALTYAAILLFRGGKQPISLRIFCAFTVLLTASGLYQVFFCNVSTYSELYAAGKLGQSGGLFPGAIALLLTNCITRVGAGIVFVLLLLLQIMTLLRITVNSLITAIKNRPRVEKAIQEPEQDPAERLVNHVATKHIERVEKRRANIKDFDLPVDDPPVIERKKPQRKRVPAPDEYLLAQQKDEQKPFSGRQVTIDELDLSERQPEPAAEPIPEAAAAPAAEAVLQEAFNEEPVAVNPSPVQEKLKKGEATQNAALIAEQIDAAPQAQEYQFPPVSLLTLRRQGMIDASSEMRENSRRLADTLQSFGIEPHIVDVVRGPSVTRFELELERGVKLNKITNLADDIALALGASGVRISAIPDKISVVGIEVPNKSVYTVFAREVIDSPTFKNSKSKLSFAVGKDISGNCIVGDIAKLPHMLIAGTTGSGKSVCMNTIILSLLYKAKPNEVRMIMVDPKMVELGVYNGIPHLLVPVVTDPKKAAGALQWTVVEMLRRYRIMSEEGVRDIESYNKAIAADPEQKPMEQIVVIIDELADLMLVAAKEVEESICRIAQMGRASGIHLVIATQRPSADVITGLMKANIPSRIAFAVASAMESRIILDTPGAEKLLGKGDMLFAPLGQGKPKRVQGCFVSDEEIQNVISEIKSQYASDYSSDVMQQIEKRAEQSGKSGLTGGDTSHSADTDGGDELLPAAVDVILETGQASVSLLQRRLKLGYARAARIVDEMEERGIVGPLEGAKPRQLLITREQWAQMKQGGVVPAAPSVEDEIP